MVSGELSLWLHRRLKLYFAKFKEKRKEGSWKRERESELEVCVYHLRNLHMKYEIHFLYKQDFEKYTKSMLAFTKG